MSGRVLKALLYLLVWVEVRSMFEDTQGLWKTYVAKHSPSWPAGDSRHNLALEIEQRLTQLDIILDYLEKGLAAMQPSEEEVRHNFDWMRKNGPKLQGGEMGEAEYGAGLWSSLQPPPKKTAREALRPWEEITLFTETFYQVAWRLGEAIGATAGRPGFCGFSGFKPRGITLVRNQLIQHPEQTVPAKGLHGLLITSQGPALKAPISVVVAATGESRPTEESIDRGLYVNARELHDEMLARLSRDSGGPK